MATLPYTLLLYESPHRLLAMLEDAAAVLGERHIVVARELTKLYEEIWRGSIGGALAHFSAGPVRGEITVVLAGASAEALLWEEEAVQEAMEAELARGLSRKEAAARVAARSGWRKRDVYNLSLSP